MKKTFINIGKALHKKGECEKGFTLIELVVVVAVLGVLATVIVPKVTGIKSDAGGAVGKTNESIIKNALERHYVDKGHYPSTAAFKSGLEGSYLDKDSTEGWTYERSADGTAYTLRLSK